MSNNAGQPAVGSSPPGTAAARRSPQRAGSSAPLPAALTQVTSGAHAAAVLGRRARSSPVMGRVVGRRTDAAPRAVASVVGQLKARSAAAPDAAAAAAAAAGVTPGPTPAQLQAENERLRERAAAAEAQLQAMKQSHSPRVSFGPAPEPESELRTPPSSPEGLAVRAARRVRALSSGSSDGDGSPSFSPAEQLSEFSTVKVEQRVRASRRIARTTSKHSLDFEVQASNVTRGQLDFIGRGLHDNREVLDSDTDSLKEARQAKFARIQIQSSGARTKVQDLTYVQQKERVKLLEGLCTFMNVEWGMTSPSVIISVTGNAVDVPLRPLFAEQFKAALLNATRCTNAWITTGGACVHTSNSTDQLQLLSC